MKKWIAVIAAIVLALLVWRGWAIYDGIVTPHAEEHDQAAVKAQKQYDLKKVMEVSDYHGSHDYHVITAMNKKGKKVFAWMADGKGKSFVKAADKGWSKDKVKQYATNKLHPKKVISIQLGVEDQVPLWEIVYRDQNNRYTFHYLRFKDGVWYRNIHL